MHLRSQQQKIWALAILFSSLSLIFWLQIGLNAIGASWNSQAALLARSQSCSANWMGLNVCSYLKQVPADPQNSRSITIATNVAGTRGNDIAGYGFAYNLVSGEYEFCTHLEAEKSEELLISDGGSGTGAANTFETGTDLSLNCVPS